METLLSDGRSYLVGDSFSVADAYFFVVANWSGHTGIDLERWPHVAAYQQRIAARETVQAALKAESAATPEESSIRSEEHTSELQSLMRISYAVFCLKKKKQQREATAHT